MPLSGYYKEHLNFDGFKHHCIGTQSKFALFPKKCYLSNKLIWFKLGYKQTAMWTGPGDPAFEYRWYDKDEFLIAKLKGEV